MVTKRSRKPRDYKAEYARRKQRAIEKGISLSIARGHPKKGEPKLSDVKKIQNLAREYKRDKSRKMKSKAGRFVKVMREKGVSADEFAKSVLITGMFSNREAYALFWSP